VAENLQSLVTQVQQYAYSEHALPSMSVLATSVSGGNTSDYVIVGGNSLSSLKEVSGNSSPITNSLTYFAVVYTGGGVTAADVHNVWSGAAPTSGIATGTVMATGVINKYW